MTKTKKYLQPQSRKGAGSNGPQTRLSGDDDDGVIGWAVLLAAIVIVPLLPLSDSRRSFVSLNDRANFEAPWAVDGLTPLSLNSALDPSESPLGVYEPAASITKAFVSTLFGNTAHVHVTTSAILHLTTVILLFVVVDGAVPINMRSQRRGWKIGACMGSAVWAVHPLRAEVIAWASCQSFALSGLFAVLAAWAHLKFTHAREHNFSLAVGYIGFFFYCAACFSNPVAIPTVVVLGAVGLVVRWEQAPPQNRREMCTLVTDSFVCVLPHVVISAVAVRVAFAANHSVFQPEPRIGQDQPREKMIGLSSVPCDICWYLWRTLHPMDLSLNYPDPAHTWRTKLLLAFILLSIPCCASWSLLRRESPCDAPRAALVLGFAVCYFALVVPTVLGLDGWEHGQRHVHDRYSYLPTMLLVPLSAMLSHFIFSIERGRTTARWCSCAVMICLFASFAQKLRPVCDLWRESYSLYVNAVRVSPQLHSNYYGLVMEQLAKNDMQAAQESFRLGLELDPADLSLNKEQCRFFMKLNEFPKALKCFQKVVRYVPNDPHCYFGLGYALSESELPGKYEAAMRSYRRVLELAKQPMPRHQDWGPFVSDTWRNMANLMFRTHAVSDDERVLHSARWILADEESFAKWLPILEQAGFPDVDGFRRRVERQVAKLRADEKP